MKTVEELSAQVDELTKKLEAQTAEVEKQKGIVVNAEKLVQKHAAEIGDLRKKSKEDDEKVAALEAEKADLDKKISAGAGGGRKKDEPEEKDETPDDIESSLDDEQKKAVEAVYSALKPEDKKRYHSDQEFRLAFLKEARERVQVVPDLPWKKPASSKPPKKDDDTKKLVASLFDSTMKRVRGMPPGGSGAARREGVEAKEPQRTVLNVASGQGFLSTLKSMRQ